MQSCLRPGPPNILESGRDSLFSPIVIKREVECGRDNHSVAKDCRASNRVESVHVFEHCNVGPWGVLKVGVVCVPRHRFVGVWFVRRHLNGSGVPDIEMTALQWLVRVLECKNKP